MLAATRTDLLDREPCEIVAPQRGVVRYCPERPWPAYRFVPGLHPHPLRDPRGHSYEGVARLNRHPPWDAARWPSLEAWRWGVDLFNAFYFWEAHEAWEGLWAAKQKGSLEKIFLQGLIQVAGALLKVHLGSPSGAIALSNEGLEKLQRVANEVESIMGLDPGRTEAAFRQYFRPLAERTLPRLDASVPVLELARAARGELP